MSVVGMVCVGGEDANVRKDTKKLTVLWGCFASRIVWCKGIVWVAGSVSATVATLEGCARSIYRAQTIVLLRSMGYVGTMEFVIAARTGKEMGVRGRREWYSLWLLVWMSVIRRGSVITRLVFAYVSLGLVALTVPSWMMLNWMRTRVYWSTYRVRRRLLMMMSSSWMRERWVWMLCKGSIEWV